MMYKFFFLSGLLFSTFTCSNDFYYSEPDEVPEPIGYDNIDEELWEYFSIFETEGEKRGKSIDLKLENLIGDISEIKEVGVAGTCQYGRYISNHVTIDKSFWNRAGYLSREFVVFHELGHCVLNRDHDESKDANGRCLSLMRSGTGDCIDAYNSTNRAYYLNELFSED